MIRGVLALPILLGGCHMIFGLAPAPGDAVVGDDGSDVLPIDAAPGDATVISDGRLCWDPTFVDDEDGDGVKDGCDNCPAVGNFAQLNSDGDDLGDVCDPHPSHQDHIALWQNFRHGLDEGWAPLSGMGVWGYDALDGGAYEQTLNSPGPTVSVYGTRKFTNATVEVVIAGIRSPTTATPATAGAYLWTDMSPPMSQTPNGVVCVERRPDGNPANDVTQIAERGGDNSTTSSGAIVGVRSQSTYLRVSSNHDGQSGMVACALARGPNTPVITIAAEPSSSAGFVAVGTITSSAKFRSLLVSELVP